MIIVAENLAQTTSMRRVVHHPYDCTQSKRVKVTLLLASVRVSLYLIACEIDLAIINVDKLCIVVGEGEQVAYQR